MLYYRTGITYHSVTLQGIHMSRNCNIITPAKLKAVRALRGISQAELARLAGVSVVSIATFEAGRSDMRASTILKLCAALGVSVTYTIGDTEIR